MINCPILLFQGSLDTLIKKNCMEFIYSNITSNTKKKIWLERNSHPRLDSPDHRQIVSEICNFTNEICP